jgi:CHAT domain-containing protein
MLPFVALLDDRKQRYWIERNAIAYAPTARVLQQALHSVRQPLPHRDLVDLTVVAGDGGPAGHELRAIAEEMGTIAKVHGRVRVFKGREATRRRFLAALGDQSIVHFAGHAVANAEYPELSYLLFPAEPEGQDRLYGFEIRPPSPPQARLVVLAACSTAAGAVSRGEGVLGLTRMVVATGVPTVVATLWDVEDRVSADLFKEFYQKLYRGSDSILALQAAQLALHAAVDPDHRDPRIWAAYSMFGAPYRFASTDEAPLSGMR